MLVLVLVAACLLHIVIQTVLIWYAYKDVPSGVVSDDIGRLKPQKPVVLTITGGLMDKYTYKIGLPAMGANDVVARELHVVINGEESMYEITDMTMTHYELVLEENAQVDMWMVDIDDAGNRSMEGEHLIFTVVDIVPPSAPSAPVIADVSVYEEPVVEEPVVEEPVVEEPVVEEPVVEEPVVEEPVAEEPVVEEPVVEEPVAEEPVVEEPVVEEPVAEEPAAEEEPPVA